LNAVCKLTPNEKSGADEPPEPLDPKLKPEPVELSVDEPVPNCTEHAHAFRPHFLPNASTYAERE
jgi:hypothetical protein